MIKTYNKTEAATQNHQKEQGLYLRPWKQLYFLKVIEDDIHLIASN